jgi:hypothetical protein
VRINTNIPAYQTAAINSDCPNKLKKYISTKLTTKIDVIQIDAESVIL